MSGGDSTQIAIYIVHNDNTITLGFLLRNDQIKEYDNCFHNSSFSFVLDIDGIDSFTNVSCILK